LPPEAPGRPREPQELPAAPRGIVFDLDGTLIDSRRDITAAVNGMRAERDLPPLPVAEVSAMVGEGARVLVRRALPPAAGKEQLKEALASYLAHYAEVCLDTTRPYPGVPAMLATLAQGFSLAVLSNKGEALSRRILAGLGLDRYLREVVGGDTLPTRKPNPGGLFALADRLGVLPEQLLMVGDSPIDAQTAHAAGCPFALTLWGAAHPASVAQAVPAPHGKDSGGRDGAAPDAGGEAAEPGWRFAHPGDLLAALGLAEDAE
jgi:phosphoglycolate phosphatase